MPLQNLVQDDPIEKAAQPEAQHHTRAKESGWWTLHPPGIRLRSTRHLGLEHHFDTVILLVLEDVVTAGCVVQAHMVGDDPRGVQRPI